YLKAVQKAGTDETEAVSKQLHEMPFDDVFGRGGTVGANGPMIHDMYLLQVKKPSEIKEPWDYFNVLAAALGGIDIGFLAGN
ncbi:ABC transporter substrate-binding protein, partial [Rhizobium leguminosarum]|uniref:ABC transporter substrate-binding protein n=1 Tax=Rhizobium leguminosarum TaxID=384 RepID=UPI003F9E11C7